MTEAKKKEFTSLKRIRAEQGFWTKTQQGRWDVLFDLHRAVLKKKLQDLDKFIDEKRLMQLN